MVVEVEWALYYNRMCKVTLEIIYVLLNLCSFFPLFLCIVHYGFGKEGRCLYVAFEESS